MNKPLILEEICKSFIQGNTKLEILKNANLALESGKITSLIGSSGSGKTTLLQIAGLLDNPDSGTIIINNNNISNISDGEKTTVRKNQIGFIYQFHHLLKEFTAIENVMMPEFIKRNTKKIAIEKASFILEKMGLKDRMKHFPAELSGGEQQRVAIARAIVGNPSILLADEATGNLDAYNAKMIMEYLMKIVEEFNIASLFVTHNLELAKSTNNIVTISEGEIITYDI